MFDPKVKHRYTDWREPSIDRKLHFSAAVKAKIASQLVGVYESLAQAKNSKCLLIGSTVTLRFTNVSLTKAGAYYSRIFCILQHIKIITILWVFFLLTSFVIFIGEKINIKISA